MEFKGISYSIRINKNEIKPILHNLNGKFQRGKLIGIIGPSGAGKSTLLNILSGYYKQIIGDIYLDGRLVDSEEIRRKSCYIMQESHLQPLLTVEENMQIAANFKLGDVDSCLKNNLIDNILDLLGLKNIKLNRISKISGGEKKRLSIGLELINNPSIMFLDEPTTGLDSVSCYKSIDFLKTMSFRGKTVICTIHQPSATVFDLLDYVYILNKGCCLYQGHPKHLLHILENLGLPCPIYHNPADFVMEIANGDYGEQIINRMLDETKNIENFPDTSETSSIEENSAITARSRCYEMKTLFLREFTKSKRNPTLTYLRLITSISNALVVSSIFWKVGSDAAKVWYNYNCILGFVLHLMMPSLMLTVLSIPSEVLILKQEYFNRWFSLKTFYAVITLVDLPISLVYCVNSNVILYYLTDQPLEWYRFLMFTSMGFLLILVAQTLGLLIGTIYDVTNGTFIASAISFVMLIFGGFFITLRDIPIYLKWLTHFSYIRYGIEGMVGAVNGYNRTISECSYDYKCIYYNTEIFMKDIGIEGDRFWADVVILLIIFIVLRIGTYWALKQKLNYV